MLKNMIRPMIDIVSGPMKFRLVLQPVMASIFAIIAGLKDARTGKSPYAWALFTDPSHRSEMLKDGWHSVGRIFLLAVAMDVVYQIMVEGFVYPGEVVTVAFVLAIVPYLVLRGLVNRIARKI